MRDTVLQKLIREMMADAAHYLADHIDEHESPSCGEIQICLATLVTLAERLCESYGHARMPDEWLDQINEN